MPTKYAMTQDRFLARREFHKRIYLVMLKDAPLNKYAIHVELAINYAIDSEFTFNLIEEYVKSGYVKYSKDNKEVVQFVK